MSRFKGWTEQSLTQLEMNNRSREINKYNARKTLLNGVKYDSKLEAEYASRLMLKQKLGMIISWKRQVKISLEIYGVHVCNYIIDFEVLHKDGHKEYVECKGFSTRDWKLKYKLFEIIMKRTEPETILTIVRK